MYKRFRHKVICTLMVAVLCVQQLFGVYHMLIMHASENALDHLDGNEWIVSENDPCDLCAKLTTQPAVQLAEFHCSNPAPVFFLIQESEEQLTSIVGYNIHYRRGPPSQFSSVI
ncbi:hypothetical protein [Flagellimonas algicola]|uniref:Uncharacterized protein n=1 Tax=Flagellimonas algicola TaxID=2583815 RepID=A0ABY2WMX8_9FLAO|nr:hypothetical protein [Allomuricauda algicola]TMU56357.1 hypothetical protein FGG15_02115 [Allomuricauda algicola]